MLNTNILKFCLLLLLIVLSAAASTCGTNCPSNTCTNCICGNLRTIIVPEGFCKNFSWNKDCCKCIAEKVSAMNGHFMQQSMGGLQIGIMGIFDVSLALVRLIAPNAVALLQAFATGKTMPNAHTRNMLIMDQIGPIGVLRPRLVAVLIGPNLGMSSLRNRKGTSRGFTPNSSFLSNDGKNQSH
jgi:hypothetical protein